MNGASQKGILIALGVVAAMGVAGAVMSPENTPQIIGFSTLIATSLLGLLAQIHAAKKQEDKLEKQDEKLGKMDRTADATHTLVNSQMSAQLRINAVMARRLAMITNDPNDFALAAAAEGEYHEHEKKQSIVDKGFGIVVAPAPAMAPHIPAPLPPAPMPVAAQPVTEAAVDKIIKAVEAKTAGGAGGAGAAGVSAAVESKKLTIGQQETASVVITKDEPK